MQMPPPINPSAQLDTSAEREVLRLLEEALAQPSDTRKTWLETKLNEQRAIGHRVRWLLAIAEQYRF